MKLDACTDRVKLGLPSNSKRMAIRKSEAGLMLTLDKDFRQIAVRRRVSLKQSGVVLFRIHPATPQNLAPPG